MARPKVAPSSGTTRVSGSGAPELFATGLSVYRAAIDFARWPAKNERGIMRLFFLAHGSQFRRYLLDLVRKGIRKKTGVRVAQSRFSAPEATGALVAKHGFFS